MAVLGKVMLLLLPLLKWVVLMYDCMFGWIYTLRYKPADRKKGYSKVISTLLNAYGTYRIHCGALF
jgi:hypothetical protein